jgi:hypothetical protein
MKPISLLVSICAALLWMQQPLPAKQAPPFGDSLSWDTGKEAPSLDRLRGKSVIILFFQEWCGICNGWSGDLFRQLGEAYGTDSGVVLIAIKTDGGTLKDAHKYLESRTDLRHWMVAVDDNASYYLQATGQTKLYHYLWIAPDGSMTETGKAGSYFPGNGGKRFSLAATETRPKIRKNTTALMAMDPPLSAQLQPAVNLAERGLFLGALAEVAKTGNSEPLRADAARFRERISGVLMKSVDQHKAAIADGTNETRYLSYQALCGIERDFGKSPPGQAAREAVSALSRESWLTGEKSAESEYKAIMKRAARADDESAKERIARSLKKLSEEFPDTVYGRMAAGSASGG